MCKEGNKMTIITNPCHDEESRLYDSEQNSDITFVAGYGDDTWRFPGHRAVLAAANPVFRAMLCGPMAPPLTQSLIDVKDVDKRAFEQLMRYIHMILYYLLLYGNTYVLCSA